MFDLSKDVFGAGRREAIADAMASAEVRQGVQIAWHRFTTSVSGADMGSKLAGAREFLEILERVALVTTPPSKPRTNLERENSQNTPDS